MSQYGKEGADERIRRQGELQRLGKDQGKREINIKKRDFKAPRADSRPFIPGPRGERRHRQPRPHSGERWGGKRPQMPQNHGKTEPRAGLGWGGTGETLGFIHEGFGIPWVPQGFICVHFGITWNSPMWILGSPGCPWNLWILGSPGIPSCGFWDPPGAPGIPLCGFQGPQEFPCVDFGDPGDLCRFWVPLWFGRFGIGMGHGRNGDGTP